jgi:hypothetical protein
MEFSYDGLAYTSNRVTRKENNFGGESSYKDRRKLEDNIKMALKEKDCRNWKWTEMCQDDEYMSLLSVTLNLQGLLPKDWLYK